MKSVLVARDVAPSQALRMVADTLTFSNFGFGPIAPQMNEQHLFLGSGKQLMVSEDEIAGAIRNSDVVLVGMSSSEELSRLEIFACRAAMKAGKPYGLYADTFGCAVARNWFEPVRANASFVFVLNEKEAEDARKVFPKAKVVASGNPTWDDFFYPKLTREESRSKLGIMDNETFVLSPGGKSLAINIQLWGFVLEVLNYLGGSAHLSKKKWNVVFAMHLGDQNNIGSYDDLVKFSYFRTRTVASNVIPISDMIPGMDLMISCASTSEIEAVCQRKPVISYIPHTARVRMRTTIGDVWEPVEQEVVYNAFAGDIFGLAREIGAILHKGASRSWRQEKFYPKPVEKGLALRAIVSTLQEFAKK